MNEAKVEFKRYLVIFVSALIIRMVAYMYLLQPVINKGMLYLTLFVALIHLLCGLLIGWFSKTKGWLLGFILGITLIFISAAKIFIAGSLPEAIQSLFSQKTIIIICCLVFGGHIGNKIRGMKAMTKSNESISIPKYRFTHEKQSDGYRFTVTPEKGSILKLILPIFIICFCSLLLILLSIVLVFYNNQVKLGVGLLLIPCLGVFGLFKVYLSPIIKRKKTQEFIIRKDSIEVAQNKYLYEHIHKIFIPGTSVEASQQILTTGAGTGFIIGGTGAMAAVGIAAGAIHGAGRGL